LERISPEPASVTSKRSRTRPPAAPGGRPLALAAQGQIDEAQTDGTQTDEAQPTPAARMTPTGRLAVLALVLAVVVVALALPVRGFLAQRAEIAELTARKAAAEAAIEELQGTKRLWGDDAYVRTQARSRLHYVMPGESGYVVVTPEQEPTESRPVAPVGAVTAPVTPWFTTVWDSARAVDAAQ